MGDAEFQIATQQVCVFLYGIPTLLRFEVRRFLVLVAFLWFFLRAEPYQSIDIKFYVAVL